MPENESLPLNDGLLKFSFGLEKYKPISLGKSCLYETKTRTMRNLLIRVISLPNSARRKSMANQLDSIGLKWKFFDACTSAPKDIPYDPKQARRRHGRELTQGELGCFASHRSLWQELVSNCQQDIMLVLEDDLIIDPHFFSNISNLVDAVRPYEYLRIYAKSPSSLRYEAQFLDRHICRYQREAYGTQGYFISVQAARRYMASIRSVVRPIDDEMDRYWQHHIPIRAVFPFPIMEVNLGSTIEPSRRLKPALAPSDQRAYARNRKIEQFRRRIAPWYYRNLGALPK